MPGKLREYQTSAVNITLAAPTAVNEVAIRNTAAGAITISPPAGHTFIGGVASISVPAGYTALCRPMWPEKFWAAHIHP